MDREVLGRNKVQVLGAGAQTIMFAHGFGSSQGSWRLVAPAFADAYRIILFDYVGAGPSGSAERYDDLRGYAQDVLDICATLDLANPIFVGHSISGMIGLLASIQAPQRFDRLVMIGSSPHYLNEPPEYSGGFERADVEGLLELMEKNHDGWAGFLAAMAMQNADRPELARELEASFRATDPAFARQFARATFYCDYRLDLPRATVPALILQSAEDLIVPLDAASYLHRHLPGSTLRMMRAIGHYPHVSQPAEVIELVWKYLTQSPPPGQR